MITLSEIFLVGAGIIVVILAVIEVIVPTGFHRSFPSSAFIGKDNRTSASLTFIIVWTLLVSRALTCPVIAGELTTSHSCAAITKITAAITGCQARKDDVGLLQTGWRQFLTGGLSGPYLVLPGTPAAAGMAAKGLAQSKTASGTVIKTKAQEPQSPATGVAQVFSADDGTTGAGDLRYVVFNLIVAVCFAAEFVRPTPATTCN